MACITAEKHSFNVKTSNIFSNFRFRAANVDRTVMDWIIWCYFEAQPYLGGHQRAALNSKWLKDGRENRVA